MLPISLAVVGAKFPNKRGPTRLFEIALCIPGEPINMVPEPKNPADEHAIAVFSTRGVQLGYLQSVRAVLVRQRMRDGVVTAIFQEKTDWGAVIRVAFDGEQPTLPIVAPRPAEREPESQVGGDEFWPDFIPPNE